MPSPDPMWTDVWQTIFVGGQLLLLVVAAVFARGQLNEAKELREELRATFTTPSPQGRIPAYCSTACRLRA